MPFQRVIMNGVPFWRAGSHIFAYELPVPTPETALKLGEETLYPNWNELYARRLMEYRNNVKAQARKIK